MLIISPNGYVNTDHIAEFVRDKENPRKFSAYAADGKLISHGIYQPEETIVAVIPVSGQWQKLYAEISSEGKATYSAVPIIAWALKLDGTIGAVTADDMAADEVANATAIQQVGLLPVVSEIETDGAAAGVTSCLR